MNECPSYSCSADHAAVRVRTYQCSTIEYDSGLPASCVQVPELFFEKNEFHEGPGKRRFCPWPSESVCNPTQTQHGDTITTDLKLHQYFRYPLLSLVCAQHFCFPKSRHRFREHGHGSTSSTRPGIVARV